MRAIVDVKADRFFALRVLPFIVAALFIGGSLSASAESLNLSDNPAPATYFPYPGWKGARGPANQQGRVEAILRVGNVVYIGGDLTTAADRSGKTTPRTGLAAIDANTGQLTSFAPKMDGRVFALAATADGKTLFAGGQFSTVDDKPHKGIVAFDLTSGQVSDVLGEAAVQGDQVKALAYDGEDLFVGGKFKSVNGQPRENLAKFSLDSKSARWTLADWAPKAGGPKQTGKVECLLVDAARKRVIAGGWFTTMDGKNAKRLVGLDRNSGEVTVHFGELPPEAGGKPFPFSEVIAMAGDGQREPKRRGASDESLYVAMGGPGGTALAYSLADGKLRWFYHTDGNCQSAAVVNGYPIFGFHGDYVAKEPNHYIKEYAKNSGDRIERKKLFVCDPKTGALQSWSPRFERSDPKYSPLGLWSMDTFEGTLYVGGDFTKVNSDLIERFAVFKPAGH